VNLKYVKEVRRETNGDSVVIMDSGHKVALGRSYRASLNRAAPSRLKIPIFELFAESAPGLFLLQDAAHIAIAAVHHRFLRSVPQSRDLEI
jgi:hypothetical protein